MNKPMQKSNGQMQQTSPMQPATQAGGADSAMAQSDQARSVAELQSEMAIAQRFPRDRDQALANVREDCRRYAVAENAFYSYPRGGQTVRGPTIELAKLIAQHWGNVRSGWREISRRNGRSEVEAFAIDLETNTKEVRTFVVEHVRNKTDRDGNPYTEELEGERDIYEKVANYAARRERACIESVIPRYVFDKAEEEAEKARAMGPDKKTLPEVRQDLLRAFNDFGVTKDDLEGLVGREFDAFNKSDIVDLKTVYEAIDDDPAQRDKFFGETGGETDVERELNEQFQADDPTPPPETEEPDEADTTDPTPDDTAEADDAPPSPEERLKSARRSTSQYLRNAAITESEREAFKELLRETGVWEDPDVLEDHCEQLADADDRAAKVRGALEDDWDASDDGWTIEGLRGEGDQLDEVIAKFEDWTDDEREVRACLEQLADEKECEVTYLPNVDLYRFCQKSGASLSQWVNLATDEIPH